MWKTNLVSVIGHPHHFRVFCMVKTFNLNCKTLNSNFEWTLTEDDFCIAWYDCDFYFQATTLTQNYNVRVIMSVWHPLMLQRIGKHHSCAQMEQFLIKNYSHVIGGKPWNYSYKIGKNFYMKFTDDLKVQMWQKKLQSRGKNFQRLFPLGSGFLFIEQ